MNRQKGIATTWYRGLDEKEKKDLHAILRNSSFLITQFKKILDSKDKISDQEKLSKETYKDPNWALRQADIVGYKRALQEIRELFSFIGD